MFYLHGDVSRGLKTLTVFVVLVAQQVSSPTPVIWIQICSLTFMVSLSSCFSHHRLSHPLFNEGNCYKCHQPEMKLLKAISINRLRLPGRLGFTHVMGTMGRKDSVKWLYWWAGCEIRSLNWEQMLFMKHRAVKYGVTSLLTPDSQVRFWNK